MAYIQTAYIENGTVLITVVINNGYIGSNIIGTITDSKYRPRAYVGGAYCGMSSGADSKKYVASRIDTNGRITVWTTEAIIGTAEVISFVYPLKFSK